jgi:hypothetical protein
MPVNLPGRSSDLGGMGRGTNEPLQGVLGYRRPEHAKRHQ